MDMRAHLDDAAALVGIARLTKDVFHACALPAFGDEPLEGSTPVRCRQTVKPFLSYPCHVRCVVHAMLALEPRPKTSAGRADSQGHMDQQDIADNNDDGLKKSEGGCNHRRIGRSFVGLE